MDMHPDAQEPEDTVAGHCAGHMDLEAAELPVKAAHMRHTAASAAFRLEWQHEQGQKPVLAPRRA